jgi:capsular polysaccharide biosynthesis protein
MPTAPKPTQSRPDASAGPVLGLERTVLREVLDTKFRQEVDVQNVTDASVLTRIGYDEDAPSRSSC